MTDALGERLRRREELIGCARSYVAALAERLPTLVAAAVVGSVARGDFNVWSDVDLVVVADYLPDRAPDRGRLLASDAPAGVSPMGFTPEEFRRGCLSGNPLAREALTGGVTLHGGDFFAEASRYLGMRP